MLVCSTKQLKQLTVQTWLVSVVILEKYVFLKIGIVFLHSYWCLFGSLRDVCTTDCRKFF